MRSYCALYVDVGYLLAAAATRVTGTSLRYGVVVSYPDLVARLIADAEKASGLPLLRLHWYDSGNRPGAPRTRPRRPSACCRGSSCAWAAPPRRASRRASTCASASTSPPTAATARSTSSTSLSGDDDLSEAVEEAQSHGMQVVLMAVPDRAGKPHAVSRHLIRESDDLIVLDGAVIDESVHVRQKQPETEAALSPAARLGSRSRSPGPARSLTSRRRLRWPTAPRLRPRRRRRPTPAVLAGSKVPHAAGRGCSWNAGPARVVERQRQRRQR